MAILSPLASSMFTPGIQQIADDFKVDVKYVVATTTGFVIFLGIGPLILAPLSENFGRRKLYIICFGVFALLQIPTALSPNVGFLIAVRAVSGFFGSVGIANGGGTLSDMFPASERAGIFGWYLLGPLLGPTLGPLLGGVVVQRLGWRWVYWILAIICTTNVLLGYFFLKETYAPALLAWRKAEYEARDRTEGTKYTFEGEDLSPMKSKLLHSLQRPLKILSHPIVLTMSIYQALIFGTTYSLYTNMAEIYSGRYGFSTEQVGLLYLGPGIGCLTSVWFLVPRIDTVYNALGKKHGDGGKPEYRLPLANIGAVLIPVSLFWVCPTSVLCSMKIADFRPVRLDRRIPRTLGCHHCRDIFLWHRPSHDTQPYSELLHRRIRALRCLCYRWRCFIQIDLGRRCAIVRARAVR